MARGCLGSRAISCQYRHFEWWWWGDILLRVEYCSKVHFEVMKQPNPSRVAKTEMECRCNGP